MLDFLGVDFENKWYLLLLVLIPVLWIFSYKTLSGLGRVRSTVALILRSGVLLIFIVALAEIQWRKTSDVVTVMYVVDQSESIPRHKREAMLHYVAQEVLLHRDRKRNDRAGLIAFGGDATIEIPPFDDDIPPLDSIEGLLKRTDATNLEGALKLAQASFPEDTAKRIVVVTDGNENLGDALSIKDVLAENGIGIDVVPVTLDTRNEVAVERMVLPPQIRVGQVAEARVVLTNDSIESSDGTGSVRGTLRITKSTNDQETLISEEEIVLPPGKKVFSFKERIDRADVFTYKAKFIPADAQSDTLSQNNEASAYTQVHGKGRVLMIVDREDKSQGIYDSFVSRMRDQKLDITIQGNDELFTSLSQLQAYDCVILANVARSSGDSDVGVTSFSNDQIKMLVQNTQQMGCGLIMFGGPQALGAGGWAGTELEKAMPVDFRINNDKVQAVGALVLMMHASEMAQGNYWQKVIAKEAIKTLGPTDYCGLIHWDNRGGDAWLWGKPKGLIQVGPQRNRMVASVNRMFPGDMPQFEPSMKMALAGFNRTPAAVKHMIIISDGDLTPPQNTTLAQYKKNKIKITTVAVGSHGRLGSRTLQQIASATGGKYYKVQSPNALPKIYQREARRVARPLVYEPPGGISPQVMQQHEMHQGEFNLPKLSGYVMTTRKANALVEVSVVADKPNPSGPNSTLLAAWTYDAGRAVVFTSDVTSRWANDWQQWEDYDKFFSQMITWAMRPVNEEGKFSLSTTIKDGKIQVILTAFDKNEEYWNFLNVTGSVVTPDLESAGFAIRQVAPGRYVGEIDATKSGNYFLSLNPGRNLKPIRAGVNVPYSAEYRVRETNLTLLRALAGTTPKGGQVGQMIGSDVRPELFDDLTQVNTFRHDLPKSISTRDAWPFFLMLGACLFFADVFVRRVSMSYEWIKPFVDWFSRVILRHRPEEAPDQRLERLQRVKSQATVELDERRAAARFDPQMEDPDVAPASLDEVLDDVQAKPTSSSQSKSAGGVSPTANADEDDYTARLLRAKKRAWDDEKK